MANSEMVHGARLADGRRVDVRLDGELIGAVEPCDGANNGGLDLTDYLLLSSPVEPHAHLDKALLGMRFPNATGDLTGAIDAIRHAYPSMTMGEIEARATTALSLAVRRGFTDVRTHANCGGELGNRAIEALLAVRERAAGAVGVQVVALVESPITGQAGSANRAALTAALDAGADLVGGCPSLDPDPDGAVEILLRAAAESGRDLDLHIDETTDPRAHCLTKLAQMVLDTGFAGRVTASHCVSLGAQPEPDARRIAELVARAGVGVVTLPQTNLYLQGRAGGPGQPRGLTAFTELRRAGVVLAGGGDNWRDPFNPMGRIDPMETASLLVTAGQLSVEDAWNCVTSAARTVMGLPAGGLTPGQPADVLAIRAPSLADAVADGGPDRVVIRRGRVVAQTESRTIVSPF